MIATTYAGVLSEQGRHRQALAIYRDAVRTWPADTMLFHDLAVAAQRAGLRDEAARAERAAIALDSKNAAAHNGLGLLLVDANRIDEAKQAFELAVAADSSSAEYLANLGNAKRASGDRTGAEAAYRSALNVRPWCGQRAERPGGPAGRDRPGTRRHSLPGARDRLGREPLGGPPEPRDRPPDRRQPRCRGGGVSRGAGRGAPRSSRERQAAAELLASLNRKD